MSKKYFIPSDMDAPEPFFKTAQTTHGPDCWRHHHECAVKRLENLRGFILSVADRPGTYDDIDYGFQAQDFVDDLLLIIDGTEKEKADE